MTHARHRRWLAVLAALALGGDGAGPTVAGPDAPPPSDFRLELTVAPRPAAAGTIESVVLEASGRIRCSARQAAGAELPAIEIELGPEAVAAIYREVVTQRFFELDSTYRDSEVNDGDAATLSITAGGRRHRVTTINIAVDAFDAVVLALDDRLPEERRLVYNALHVDGYRRVER